jgi:hypothetical protein
LHIGEYLASRPYRRHRRHDVIPTAKDGIDSSKHPTSIIDKPARCPAAALQPLGDTFSLV